MRYNLSHLTEKDKNTFASRLAEANGEFAPQQGPFRSLELFLTEDCNLRCDYCFVRGKRHQAMSESVAQQAIDFLVNHSSPQKDLSVLFFGGEPLLQYELICAITLYCEKKAEERGKSIHFSMTTNGTLMTLEMMKFFQRHNIKYLLSVDGTKEDHDRHRRYPNGRGSFDDLIKKLPMMKSHQPWQGARYTVHTDATTNIRAGIEFLFRHGINQFIVGPAQGIPWTDEDIAKFEEGMQDVCELYIQMKKAKKHFRMTLFERGESGKRKRRNIWGCEAARNKICVSASGELYACSKLLGLAAFDKREALCLGDVWRGVTSRDAFMLLNDNSIRYRHLCRLCEMADECDGGCPADNYIETGSIYKVPPLGCKFRKAYQRLDIYFDRRAKEEGLEI